MKQSYVFRANEMAAAGRNAVIRDFTREFKEPVKRFKAVALIDSLIEQYGPVVEGYPSWHPFTQHGTGVCTALTPKGFKGLDHTFYLRDAFVTAPYGCADEVIESAHEKEGTYMLAVALDTGSLYHPNATPVVVVASGIPKEDDGTISKRFALGRMLEEEMKCWAEATRGETWETMQPHILGLPCGSRSSPFVNQDTGKTLREVFNLLNKHGLFGPVYPR